MAKNQCKDHLGQIFESQKAMCAYWHVTASTFQQRRKKNYSLQECLCGCKKQPNYNAIPYTDHLGHKFNSATELCQHWNVRLDTFLNRHKKGWTIEECIFGKKDKSFYAEIIIDPNGKTFRNQKEMCEYWNVSYDAYLFRKRKGYDLATCLDDSKFITKQSSTDPFGNKFNSIIDMYNYWNVKQSTFTYRRNAEYSMLESLNIIEPLSFKINNWKFNDNLIVINTAENTTNNIQKPSYFICLFNNHETILHRNFIVKYCTKKLQEQYS